MGQPLFTVIWYLPMKTLESKKVIKTIAQEEGVTVEDVERVIVSHFEFVKYVQSTLVDRDTNYFPSVRLPNFGIFYVPERVKERLRKINMEKKDGTV